MPNYASYTKTHSAGRAKPQFKPGDRIAVKIVASTWQNEHGKFWAAYRGDGEKPNDDVADHGAKLPRALAESLFPQIVAAGFEWWD